MSAQHLIDRAMEDLAKIEAQVSAAQDARAERLALRGAAFEFLSEGGLSYRHALAENDRDKTELRRECDALRDFVYRAESYSRELSVDGGGWCD